MSSTLHSSPPRTTNTSHDAPLAPTRPGRFGAKSHARTPSLRHGVHAAVGGFHLGGRLFEHIIDPTVAALADLEPDVVVPAHCTGWRAQHAIAAALPDAFVPGSVGTRLELATAGDGAG